jgi:lipoprotein-anchoring transpeptidase ErfK/SrfK
VVGSLWRWLASLFHTDVIWIEKEQGRWSKSRHYHPLVRVLFFVVTLVGIWEGVEFFYYSFMARNGAKDDSNEPVAQETEKLADNGFLSDPAASPGPMPPGLVVNDNEYWVRINKKNYRLYLYRGGDIDKSYLVGVGKKPGNKERVGDNRTPNGIFTVQSIEDASSWTHDFRDGKGVIKGAYGPWFIRLRTGWRGIGIHGTHDPNSRGTMVSEGCVRMLNEELEELKRLAFKDMKVVIEE